MTRAVCINKKCKNYKRTSGQEEGKCPRCGEELHASEAVFFNGKDGLLSVSLFNTSNSNYDLLFSDHRPDHIISNPELAMKIEQDEPTIILGSVNSEDGLFTFARLDPSQTNVSTNNVFSEPLIKMITSYGRSSLKIGELNSSMNTSKVFYYSELPSKADLISWLYQQ